MRPGKRAPPITGVPVGADTGTGSPLATSGNLAQPFLTNLPILFGMGASHKHICYRFQSADLPQNEIHLHYLQIYFFKETLTIPWSWNLGDKEEL